MIYYTERHRWAREHLHMDNGAAHRWAQLDPAGLVLVGSGRLWPPPGTTVGNRETRRALPRHDRKVSERFHAYYVADESAPLGWAVRR